ncbi:glycosyltransferase family 4 protein [Flammeovirga kamogawensis]|uniref:Glycosyltransferase family 4 protein n=1 Tax=Flammeovirga kamogawensis TaxID=373891 RepID=A0ABX8GXZ1_9BACT|nr:glycosyltransferase family 4 protein [Flammeovirga kamogawensis]MBB6458903.1 hypothetical protein [Flammeovirga kamogawensis]QWG08484.1 glycosyltransferase family 4 protein [Flammeovirga kamogawensis]TRX66779.1 glycosyltransferase family 4 protein [Flammeovirga kamogawensis]
MKLLFLTDNFPPEVNAPATRTFEHCKEWVKKGTDVTVITCFPNFPQGKVYTGYKNKLFQKEIIDGIKVIRVWSYISANDGFLKRIIDYNSYAIMAFFASFFVKTDIIIATSPQFFTALSGQIVSFFKRVPWIMEVRDLWPESIRTVGAMDESKILDFFEWIELKLYRSAKKIIVVTDSFKTNLTDRGVPSEKIEVVKNGANIDLFKPIPKDKLLLQTLNLENKFIAGYIGTHGMAHKLDFIIESIKDLEDKSIHLLFVGAGAGKKEAVDLAKKYQLTNVTFLPPVPKEEVSKYISILDCMLVPLKKADTFKTVIPSKIFETAAMEIPILLGVDGEARSIIEKYSAGLYFEPENKEEFISQLIKLKNDKTLYQSIQKGCNTLALDFDRKVLADKMYTSIINKKTNNEHQYKTTKLPSNHSR